MLAAAGARIYARVGSSPTRAAWGGGGRESGSELESAGVGCVHGRGARVNGRLGAGVFFFQEAMRESFRIGGFGFLPEILCGAWQQR